MIGLDTNVLVRYLVQDDPVQSPKATALVESLTQQLPGFVTLVALVELVWVIQGAYRASKAETVAVLEKLLRVDVFMLEHSDLVAKALRMYMDANADFADCLIERAALHAGCTQVVTFDSKAAKTAGMRLLA